MDLHFRKLPPYFSVAIAVALAMQVSSAAWMMTRKPGRAVAPGPDVQHVLTARAPLNIAVLVAQHLFGQVAADPSKVVATTLALRLVGTFAEADPEAGMAFMAESTGSQHIFRVGQELPGGGVLRQVYARQVVIERDGHYEELRFPPSSLRFAAPPSLASLDRISYTRSGFNTPPVTMPEEYVEGMRTPQEQAEAERGVPQWQPPPDPPTGSGGQMATPPAVDQ